MKEQSKAREVEEQGVEDVERIRPNLNKAVKGVGKGLKQAVAVGKGLKKDPHVEAVKEAVGKGVVKATTLEKSLDKDGDFKNALMDAKKAKMELTVAVKD